MKPENIWVGNFGEVYLLDWGVAKVWGHADDNIPLRDIAIEQSKRGRLDGQLQTLTGGGQRPGTPLYMSPEQVQGNRGIDERTDIFSVGVCLYEMLALSEPFRGAHINETFDNIQNKQPDSPSTRSPHLGIPKRADAVVMRAIDKAPSFRFQSMRDMIAAIRDIEC